MNAIKTDDLLAANALTDVKSRRAAADGLPTIVVRGEEVVVRTADWVAWWLANERRWDATLQDWVLEEPKWVAVDNVDADRIENRIARIGCDGGRRGAKSDARRFAGWWVDAMHATATA